MKALVLIACMFILAGCAVTRTIRILTFASSDGPPSLLAKPSSAGLPEVPNAPLAIDAAANGPLCGDPFLSGSYFGAFPGPGACGIENGASITAVAGVPLSQPARLNCETARKLSAWLTSQVYPSFAADGGVVSVAVLAHYSCRTRNNQPGAKVSEHGFGRAVDIGGFKLGGGDEVSVLEDWDSRAYGARLKAFHRAACGPFGTVLGPDADRFHKDHFHLDTAVHGNGSYCR